MLFQWTAVLYTGEGKGTLPPPPLSPLWGGGVTPSSGTNVFTNFSSIFVTLKGAECPPNFYPPPPLTKILYTTPYEKSFMRQIIYNYTESLQITDTFHGKDSKRFSRQPIA